MKELKFDEIVDRSNQIRKLYHQLELQCHDREWSVEEDALAFLTDAGLVGRLTMTQQGRWPENGQTNFSLEHKLGECIWWLIVLADRMNINISDAVETFLSETESSLQDPGTSP